MEVAPVLGSGCFQIQSAIIELSERIHGQYRLGEVSGLRFQGGDFRGFNRLTDINRESRMTPRTTGSA
jgi:hypothetical protein